MDLHNVGVLRPHVWVLCSYPSPRGTPGLSLCYQRPHISIISRTRAALSPPAWFPPDGGVGPHPSPFPADPSLSSAPETETPAPGVELFYLNGTFRLLQKPLRWQDALLLCESRNSSLAHVPDPYTQAFLTQAARDLRTPLWIGLSSEEVGFSA